MSKHHHHPYTPPSCLLNVVARDSPTYRSYLFPWPTALTSIFSPPALSPECLKCGFLGYFDDWVFAGFSFKVIRLLKDMVSEANVSPNEYIFAIAISSCCDRWGIEEGRQCHALVVFDCSRCNGVWNEVPGNDIVAYNSILSGFLENGYLREGLDVLRSMLSKSMNAIINMYGKCGNSLMARGFFNGLQSKNVVLWTVVMAACFQNALRNGSSLHGHSEKSDMMHRDIITWNAMICGFSHHGLGKRALLMFHVMLAAEEHPNSVTFTWLLSACSHLGLVQDGFYYLHHLIKQFGVQTGLEHYTCIVGLLCRAGRVDDAHNFMRIAPVKWDVVAWRTLLNACHVHRYSGLVRQVAETVLEMDPHDVGTYTLLSNMYAKEKRSDGVVKIGKLMRDKNIKKEPGALLAMIKLLGYSPDIGAVLHDVKDEPKEYNLCYHSEKLAIAYGLLKMPSEASILVIKNLRMCDDCHSAVRFISKVTNRVITVRDANRFHHFRDGSFHGGRDRRLLMLLSNRSAHGILKDGATSDLDISLVGHAAEEYHQLLAAATGGTGQQLSTTRLMRFLEVRHLGDKFKTKALLYSKDAFLEGQPL
ncbi:unnamed protein product [Dovyalis caffra]|uniref:DYW domain-containing protein n=1 Tax=Dovyalis caffra TaxID=77055 RepID=A0AAV1R4Q1_9ROSI|nr:unnamed protein product [Dovyalis caffra]